MDWCSRKVLSWRLYTNTMETDFCVDALEEVIIRYGCPEVLNTDQGSQFSSDVFIDTMKQHNIQINMDGKGRWIDNVFIERLWRSLKYEEVYLHAYESVLQAHLQISQWLKFYNQERPHQTLDYQIPDVVYNQTPRKSIQQVA